MLCAFRYTLTSHSKARDKINYKHCLEIASFILFPQKFVKKPKYVWFCYKILWAKPLHFFLRSQNELKIVLIISFKDMSKIAESGRWGAEVTKKQGRKYIKADAPCKF